MNMWTKMMKITLNPKKTKTNKYGFFETVLPDDIIVK
jgi:hypothetical protein